MEIRRLVPIKLYDCIILQLTALKADTGICLESLAILLYDR